MLVGFAVATVVTLVVGLVQHPDGRALVLLAMVPAGLAAALGIKATSKAIREAAVCFGILQCCGLLVTFSGGVIEAHFSFFVVLPLIALYPDWRPFAFSVGYVAVEHALVGIINPHAAFDHQMTGMGSPFKWAAVHAGFIVALCIVMIVYWNLSDRQRLQLEVALADLNLTQSTLVQAQKLEAIGQLAAGIAHEINTPVQFVADNARFLAESFDEILTLMAAVGPYLDSVPIDEDTPELARLRAAISTVDVEFLGVEIPGTISESRESLERVAEIVRALKDFSHPGVGRSDTDVNRAIESTVQVSRNEWKYVAEMILDLDPDVGLLPCFEGELKQVILNLVVKAAHAIDAQREATGQQRLGHISISIVRSDEWVTITISDDGTGMSDDVRRRIFDPFFTTKGVGKGTGQGLTIAYSAIVQKHEGRIDVNSAPGHGSSFILQLPLRVPTLTESDGAPATAELAGTSAR